MKKRVKIASIVVAIIVVLGLGGLAWVQHAIYQPSATATRVAKKATTTTNKYTYYKGYGGKTSVIFYPGALVSPNSYSIWAENLAQHGYNVYVMHFPLALAVLAANQADAVPRAARHNYVIGGHSLGGVMASRYAHDHQTAGLKGVFYLASYPDKKGDLSKTHLAGLSVTASRDGVLNWQHYRENRRYLPKKTTFTSIKGGNHGGFGSYGQQKGDRQATISNAQQQTAISQRLVRWLARLQ